MTPPEMLDEPAASPPTGPAWTERVGTDANLRTELVHRHLLARVGVAQEHLQVLEDHSPAPEALVARFGSAITEMQRALDVERAQVVERVEARRRATEDRAAAILREAEAEAAAIRDVAARLRSESAPPRPAVDLWPEPAAEASPVTWAP